MDKIYAYGICLYKIRDNNVEILLCRSTHSKIKWGFLKGSSTAKENRVQTAIREFEEESGIKVDPSLLEKYYEQQNSKKDIGIFLVNFDKIDGIEKYFSNNRLKFEYICFENDDVRFFNIDNLPPIKKKQKDIVDNIIKYFKD